MSRFLRGRTEYTGRLAPPVRVFPADPPTQLQQTLLISLATVPCHVRVNRAVRRATHSHLPLVVYPAAAPPVELIGSLARFTRRRIRSQVIEPVFYPPVVTDIAVTLLPTLRRQRPRRVTRHGLGGPQAVDAAPLALAIRVALTRARRPITQYGISAPTLINAPPLAPSIRVTLTAVESRLVQRRPIAGLRAPRVTSAAVVFAGPRVTLTRFVRRPVHSRLAPPQFYPATSTISVTLAARARAVLVARLTHPRLAPPVVLQTFPGTAVTSSAARSRAARPPLTRSVLRPPAAAAAVSALPPVLIHVVRRTAQHAPFTRIYAPTTLQVFAGPQVALTKFVRRPVHSRLAGPQFYPATSEIQTGLAGRTRTETQRRRARWFLTPPTVLRVPSVEQQEQTVRVVLAPKTRRLTHSRLAPPVVLQVFTGPATHWTRTTRPRVHSRLAPPIFYPATSTISVTLAGRTRASLVRRPARYGLGLPKVIGGAAPTPDQSTVKVLLAGRTRVELGRRAPHSALRSPIFYRATSSVHVTVVRLALRRVHSRLAPPTVLATFGGPRVTLAPARRPRTIYGLRAPLVAKSPLAPPATVKLVRVRRPETYSKLAGPVVAASDLARRIITVQVPPRARRRTDYGLRPPVVIEGDSQTVYPSTVKCVRIRPPAVHSKLRAPVFLPATSRIRTTLVRTRPRATCAFLTPPAALQTFYGPQTVVGVRRTRDVRRAARSLLRPPAVVRAAFVANPLTVSLAPARRPLTRSRLTPPVFYPATSTITTVLTRITVPPTRSQVLPPQVISVQFIAALISVTLAPARRPHPVYRLARPAVIAPRPVLQPPVYVKCVAVSHRATFQRRAPHFFLRPYGPISANGVACLIDLPAALACLENVPAALACLLDRSGANACLTNGPRGAACLSNRQAFTATLVDEE